MPMQETVHTLEGTMWLVILQDEDDFREFAHYLREMIKDAQDNGQELVVKVERKSA